MPSPPSSTFSWRLGRAVSLLLLVTGGPGLAAAEGPVVLDASMHLLGRDGPREWKELDGQTPEGPALTVRFQSPVARGPAVLLIRQREVKLDWPITLNGRSIGRLSTDEADLVHTVSLPEGAVHPGENLLRIGPAAGSDDVRVGEVTLEAGASGSLRPGTGLAAVVREASGGQAIPCRLTVVDGRGVRVSLAAAGPSPRLAVRPGVAYTADGRARLSVRPGRYRVYATRGFEYGLASREVEVVAGRETPVELALEREVDTPGLVAADTHIHTLTLSGHGDATLDERLVTLAGEGIELPIATEHDHLGDYAPRAEELGLRRWFTPVVGDEVTTRRGHFNAFPFAAGEPPPDAERPFWPELMTAIRAGRSDRFVVLNHPRDVHAGFRPFGPSRFNAASGEDRQGTPFEFDAVEVINSGALQSDPMRVVRDWFALWNHGLEPAAVAGSDSHDVARFVVGQGRTYVACPDGDPGKLDVERACQSFRAGRTVAGLGLLAELKVDGRFGPGDLATGVGQTLRASVRVLGPSWASADRVELFANGVLVQEARIEGTGGRTGEKARVEWTLERPPHDVALVAVASGPGVRGPFWAIPRPYQPSSRTWEPRLLSVTSPVRVDADGSGGWNSPRYYAQLLIEINGTEPGRLFHALGPFDEAVATQAAAFCLPSGRDQWTADVAAALGSAPPRVRRGFAAYLDAVRQSD